MCLARTARAVASSSVRARNSVAVQVSDPIAGTTVAITCVVAVLTFLLSFLSRKAGDIVQAVFGWSVTALFGKLPRRTQFLVTAALVLSVGWPLFVLGVFAPKLADWAIAMLPLHDWIGDAAMRVIWIVLAVLTPLVVGLLVHVAAPNRKRGRLSVMIQGYPIAIGLFAATVVVLVTVPTVKVASIVRGWTDEHVYLQPHEGKYEDVLRALAEASARGGYLAQIDDVPGYMVFATTIIRTMAGGAVAPFVSEKLRRITSNGLQMYLYPGDLLMRGRSTKLARVRAMFSRTRLDAHAYLVASDDAKHVQDELARLNEMLGDQESHHVQGTAKLATRLREVSRELMRTDVPYQEWAILESMARRVERR